MESTYKKFRLYAQDRGEPLNGIKTQCEIVSCTVQKDSSGYWAMKEQGDREKYHKTIAVIKVRLEKKEVKAGMGLL